MKISVLIPTWNRPTLLLMTMNSLRMQDIDKSQLEIIIADRGKVQETRRIVKPFLSDLNIKLIPIKNQDDNVSYTRNIGIRAASNELLVMIDCGVICPRSFLSAHNKTHQLSPIPSVTIGPAYGLFLTNEDDFWRSINPCDCPLPKDLPKNVGDIRISRMGYCDQTPWREFWTVNCSVRKDILERVGLFDENFKGWGFEDIELGYRLHRLGLNFVFNLEAWCLHYPHPRVPFEKRNIQNQNNWLKTYNKYLDPALEIWPIAWRNPKEYDIYLQDLKDIILKNTKEILILNDILETLCNDDNIIYFGFRRKKDAKQFGKRFILSPVPIHNELRVIYSFGITTPYVDKQFNYAIISPYWKYLLIKYDPNLPYIFQFILKEAIRIAKNIIILIPKLIDPSNISILNQIIKNVNLNSDNIILKTLN